MENFQVPDFLHSLQTKKNLYQFEWFEVNESDMQSSSYDDYILLRRSIEDEPIIGYLVKVFGGKIAKKERLP